MLGLEFGELLGGFLESMGETFDGVDKKSTLEENLSTYKTKLLFLSMFSKQNQAKFNKYTIKAFNFFTMRNNWEKRLVVDRLKEIKI
jgi:hypothetical protein